MSAETRNEKLAFDTRKKNIEQGTSAEWIYEVGHAGWSIIQKCRVLEILCQVRSSNTDQVGCLSAAENSRAFVQEGNKNNEEKHCRQIIQLLLSYTSSLMPWSV